MRKTALSNLLCFQHDDKNHPTFHTDQEARADFNKFNKVKKAKKNEHPSVTVR